MLLQCYHQSFEALTTSSRFAPRVPTITTSMSGQIQEPDTVSLLLSIQSDTESKMQKRKSRHHKKVLRVMLGPQNQKLHKMHPTEQHHSKKDEFGQTNNDLIDTKPVEVPELNIKDNQKKELSLENQVYQLYWDLDDQQNILRQKIQHFQRLQAQISMKRAELRLYVGCKPLALNKHKSCIANIIDDIANIFKEIQENVKENAKGGIGEILNAIRQKPKVVEEENVQPDVPQAFLPVTVAPRTTPALECQVELAPELQTVEKSSCSEKSGFEEQNQVSFNSQVQNAQKKQENDLERPEIQEKTQKDEDNFHKIKNEYLQSNNNQSKASPKLLDLTDLQKITLETPQIIPKEPKKEIEEDKNIKTTSELQENQKRDKKELKESFSPNKEEQIAQPTKSEEQQINESIKISDYKLNKLLLKYLKWINTQKRNKYYNILKARELLHESIQHCQQLTFQNIRNGAKLTQLKLQLRLIELDLNLNKKQNQEVKINENNGDNHVTEVETSEKNFNDNVGNRDNNNHNNNANSNNVFNQNNMNNTSTHTHEQNSKNSLMNCHNGNTHSCCCNNNVVDSHEVNANQYHALNGNHVDSHDGSLNIAHSTISINIYDCGNENQQKMSRPKPRVFNTRRHPFRPQIIPIFGRNVAPQVTKVRAIPVKTELETVECQLDPKTCEPQNNCQEKAIDEIILSPQVAKTIQLKQPVNKQENEEQNIKQDENPTQILSTVDEEVLTESTHTEQVQEPITKHQLCDYYPVFDEERDKVKEQTFQKQPEEDHLYMYQTLIIPFFGQFQNQTQATQQFKQFIELLNFKTIMEQYDNIQPYYVRTSAEADITCLYNMKGNFQTIKTSLGSKFQEQISNQKVGNAIEECKQENNCEETIIFYDIQDIPLTVLNEIQMQLDSHSMFQERIANDSKFKEIFEKLINKLHEIQMQS